MYFLKFNFDRSFQKVTILYRILQRGYDLDYILQK